MIPLIGQVCGVVFDVVPVSIHGDEYLDVLVQTAEQEELGQGTRFRVPRHVVDNRTELVRGCRVELSLLMQQVTAVRVVATTGDATGQQ